MGEVPTIRINGKDYELGPDIGEDERLVNFLFDKNLKGTHTTCFEGGCGACIVVASVPDPVTGSMETYSVNSCLVPVLSCAGWEVTTIEGLGNSLDGFHVVQDRLAEYSGTQCGYCSPGMVMNMYGLTQNNPAWTASDVEKSLDANICRCTGYRPILEAFKSITTKDIEDSHLSKCAKAGKGSGCPCAQKSNSDKTKPKGCCKQTKSPRGMLPASAKAYQPTSLTELYSIIAALPPEDGYSLIVGNTAQAVVGGDYTSKATIYIRNIPELSQVTQTTENVGFGACISISRMMKEMKQMSSSSGYAYLDHLADTWQHVAGTSVRNLGSWAGNLAVRSTHLDFPSDLFTHLVTAGATITVGTTDGSTTTHSVEELIGMDLVTNRKVILHITFPKMADNVIFRVFKVCARATNSHAVGVHEPPARRI
ncbi:hypothetical protein SK128_004965 [Halocaridina rubra]|uniref:FAD-binding PCMH-type domain-containing protein n=1 Tax=Halocaridina rubra TaxID=373956 RepID=A0AAN8X4P6_HALRR